MNDVWNKLKKWIEHNQGLCVALVLAGILVFYGGACESTTASIRDPEKKVTRAELDDELEQEVQNLITRAELAYKDLDRQDQIKAMLFDVVQTTAAGGVVNPWAIGLTALGILGVGAAVDNRRKDGVIGALKSARNATQ